MENDTSSNYFFVAEGTPLPRSHIVAIEGYTVRPTDTIVQQCIIVLIIIFIACDPRFFSPLRTFAT
jgi:hypothetical protein